MRIIIATGLFALISSSAMAGNIARDVRCDGCVNTGNIAAGAVKTFRIAEDGVTQTQIAPDAVGEEEIIDGSVGFDELSADVADAINSGGSGSAGGEFIGFSDTTVGLTANSVKALSEACIDTYGPGARVATSLEIANATTFPDASSPRAWILPSDVSNLGTTDFCGVDGVANGAIIRTATFKFATAACGDTLVVACAQ